MSQPTLPGVACDHEPVLEDLSDQDRERYRYRCKLCGLAGLSAFSEPMARRIFDDEVKRRQGIG